MDGYDINKLSISLTSNALPGPHTSWQNRTKSHGMRTSVLYIAGSAADPIARKSRKTEKLPRLSQNEIPNLCRNRVCEVSFGAGSGELQLHIPIVILRPLVPAQTEENHIIQFRPSAHRIMAGLFKHEQESHGDHAAPGRGALATGVLAKARQGAAKKLAKPATLTFPLKAGEGSIEMPRQTETPEGASVAPNPVGGFARRVSSKDEICQPSPSASTSTRPPIQSPASRSQEGSAKTGEPTAVNRAAVKITALTREARDELEALRNISREVKTSVCEKLQRIAELALRLEESRSRHILEVEREKTKRARDLEEAERRLQKTTEHHLDRCLRVETAVANMAADIKRTQDAIDRMDIPNKLEGLRKTLEVKPTTYAAAAAKPKLQAAAKPQVPGPKIAATHTLIVRPDAPTTPATRWSKPSGVSKPEPSLPLVIIRDVLKVNSDEQIIESLKRQNGHTTEGLDWGKVEARVRYRRRARNPLECHPVLEVSPALYTRLIKAGFVYVGLQRRPVWDQSPLVQCSRCLGFGHSKKYCRELNDKCAHCGGDHTGPLCPGRKAAQPPKCINCTRAGCEDVAHSAFSQECGVRTKWDAIARTKVAYC
ncbi:hypothetical protein EVAR_43633_1 [Eumeta japonica]|uniref:Nucleic-acid-binding protein from transposon X-element n=1 Tax=Eumeta variegata TaxID=151549 RepID=A0A4C1XHN2_EUMVA|nr:hypothetical protein EVAR_43633_1 [Eumeta japonica]